MPPSRRPVSSPTSPTLIGCCVLLAGVTALQFAAAAIGHWLAMSPSGLVPLWPPVGVLLALLLASERRVWPWLGAATLLGMLAADLRFGAGASSLPLAFGDAVLRVAEAGAGAVWLQLIFHAPELLARMRNVIAFVLILAGVSCAGAALAQLHAWAAIGGIGFGEFQVRWVADYLGMALFTPLLLSALSPGALPTTSALVAPWAAPVQLLVLAAASQVAFGGTVEPRNLAEVPYIVYPVLVWIAFRAKPPQLVLVALVIVACIAVLHGAAGHGPFAHAHFSAFGSVLSTQIFLAVTTVTTLLLAAAVFERRHALIAAHATDESYRSFVRSSHDAIWRVEIEPPLPLATADPCQRELHLRAHARIAEHNDTYARTGGTGARLPRPWHEDGAWFGPCSAALAAGAAMDGGNIEAKLRVPGPDGEERIVLCELSPAVEANALVRVWGSAMDVTAQERSQAELEAQRTELRSLTSQLMLAEERARRATAADLHDGIGQNLSAIIMWQAGVLEGADERERAEILEHIRAAATESLQWTREIIADLSPPGLYDMGLESALKSLVARIRQRHGLVVVVERCELPPELGVETKVTLFQCLRELLSNSVKHAQAREVRVDIHHEGGVIRARVADDGRGLEPARFQARPSEHGGFGLFMIRERLAALRGTLAVERAAAGGAQVSVTIPYLPGPGP